MIALPPHGHDRTSYDIVHCCLCSPHLSTATHKWNDKGVCERCGFDSRKGDGDEKEKPEVVP